MAFGQVATVAYVRFGPRRLNLSFDEDSEEVLFIREAFLSHDAPGDLDLFVCSQRSLPHPPRMHWAQPWIDVPAPIPFEISHPYRIHIDRHAGVISVLDTRTNSGAVWRRHPTELDARILVTPFRIILNWMAGSFDASLLHSAAVNVDGKGLLLCGPSGAGKSTLALALGIEGHSIVSDDCVLLHGRTAYAVFSRAKVDERSLRLIDAPRLHPYKIRDGDFPKRFIDLRELGSNFSDQVAVDCLAVPSVGRIRGVYPLDAREAYRVVGEEARRETGGGTSRDHLRIARLCGEVPSFRVLVTEIEGALEDLLPLARSA